MRTAILSVILLHPATLQAQNTRRIEPSQSASHSKSRTVQNRISNRANVCAESTSGRDQCSRHRPSVHFRQTNSACMTCMATSCSGFRIAFRTHFRNIQRMVLPVAPQRCQSIRLTKYTGIRAVGFDNPLARAFMAISFTVSLLCHQVFPTGQSC